MGGCITSAGPAHRRLWGFSVPYVCTTPVALVAFMSHFPSGNGQAAVNLDDRSRLVTAGRSCRRSVESPPVQNIGLRFGDKAGMNSSGCLKR
jgi:hypothetical protein